MMAFAMPKIRQRPCLHRCLIALQTAFLGTAKPMFFEYVLVHHTHVVLLQGVLDSFLIEITSLILPTKDKMGDGFLVDKILDKTGMKGTGATCVRAVLLSLVAAGSELHSQRKTLAHGNRTLFEALCQSLGRQGGTKQGGGLAAEQRPPRVCHLHSGRPDQSEHTRQFALPPA